MGLFANLSKYLGALAISSVAMPAVAAYLLENNINR